MTGSPFSRTSIFGFTIIRFIRRLLLIIFFVTCIPSYKMLAEPPIEIIVKLIENKFGFNYKYMMVIISFFADYKNCNWLDGFLWGIAVSIYIGFCFFLWNVDSKRDEHH